MKIKLSQLKPNPFKKEIHEGKLSQDQVNRIKANIKELGLMGAFPIFQRGSEYFLIAGHHRQEALRQIYGNNFEVECIVHDYDDDKVLRGMIVENLTQRNDDFKENVENLVAIRKWLQKNECLLHEQSSKKLDSKGRENRQQEAGSIRHISDWLNKNGEVMSPTSIHEHLSVHDRLDKELFDKVEKTHKGDATKRKDDNVLSKTQAILLSSIEDKKEQKELATIMINEKKKDNSEATGSAVRSQGKQISAYKKADEDIKEQVREGKIELKEVPKLMEIQDKEVRNAVINKDLTISQAESISKLKDKDKRSHAIKEFKALKVVETNIVKNSKNRDTAKEKRELQKQLIKAETWIKGFKTENIATLRQLEKTIKVLLLAVSHIPIMDEEQKERLMGELELFIEKCERGQQLAEQIKEKVGKLVM